MSAPNGFVDGETGGMSSSSIHAEVSSITDTIAGLRERIASLAPALGSPETEDLLSTLFEAERSLLAAGRHLERAKRLSARHHGT